MSERALILFLDGDVQDAYRQVTGLWKAHIKPRVERGQAQELELRPKRRSSAANKKLHAEIGEIAETLDWAGKKRDTETWKRLLVAAWLRAVGDEVEELPALDGRGVDVVFRRTSTLSKAETAELIEFVMAWKAEHMPPAED